jgi:hypothetical protein
MRAVNLFLGTVRERPVLVFIGGTAEFQVSLGGYKVDLWAAVGY